ncbi:MAG: GSU2403 family nucleotidyltransferase fold protein [Kiritimatiellales bacterium]
MQKPQYELCCEVLRRLRTQRVLPYLVLTGSWCLLLYRQYFERNELFSSLRTRDMDFLVPIPFNLRDTINIPELLKDLGFLTEYKGSAGYMQLIHPEVMLEFLVPQRGRETDRPFDLPQLGLNAQRLRYMDIALMKPIKLMFEDVPIRVPHPACFALHKLLVAPRRKEAFKKERDIEIAVELLGLLFARNDQPVLKEVFCQFPASWRKTALNVLSEAGQKALRDRLAELIV